MNKIFCAVVTFSTICLSTAANAGSNDLLVCQKLANLYQTQASLTCVQIVSSGTFDVGALGEAEKLVDLYQYQSALDALTNIKGKKYSQAEISMCDSYLQIYNYSAALTCLKTSGTAATSPSAQQCPATPDKKALLGKIKSIELLLVDRSQASIDTAFKTLEEIRSQLENSSN